MFTGMRTSVRAFPHETVCVCVRVCTCMNLLHVGVHVSALGSMGRVRNNDDDDTGMITALLKVLSCALCWAPF